MQKCLAEQTKQTNDQFSAKNILLSAVFPFWTIFFENDFEEDGQKHKMVIKIQFTPFPDCNILPFLKGLKKIVQKRQFCTIGL